MSNREEAQSDADGLGQPENSYWDEKKQELQELPEKPTPAQLRESLLMTRADTSEALKSVLLLIDLNSEAIRKLQGHRHSLEKNYSALPEL